jgi:hypothetical protein
VADDTLPPSMGNPDQIQAALERHFERVRAWQQTPEGARARARWEKDKLAKARAEREELCGLRGVPLDHEVRRYALDAHPDGQLFEAIREAIGWQREQQERTGGRVPAMRVLVGPPGTGKTCALAWACASWQRRALYRTADTLCALKKTDPEWREAVSVSLLCIDELGIEAYPEVLVELMLQRWTAGLLTLSASNLSVEEFISRYLSRAGERLADRLTQQRHRGLRTFVKATWASYRGAEGRL